MLRMTTTVTISITATIAIIPITLMLDGTQSRGISAWVRCVSYTWRHYHNKNITLDLLANEHITQSHTLPYRTPPLIQPYISTSKSHIIITPTPLPLSSYPIINRGNRLGLGFFWDPNVTSLHRHVPRPSSFAPKGWRTVPALSICEG